MEIEQICKGNNEEKFLPLVRRHKVIFMNAKGMICLCVFVSVHNEVTIYIGNAITAYYDQK